jgi:hypothetical protein
VIMIGVKGYLEAASLESSEYIFDDSSKTFSLECL